MAYTPFENTSVENNGNLEQNSNNSDTITLNAGQGEHLALPDASYVTEADMLKDGYDLVLQTSDGSVVIEGYFAQETPPFLVAPGGKTLTPDLVDSFAHSEQEYANADLSTSDVSPVGAIQEISGEAHVIRTDGTVETIGVGTHIFQGDIVETEEDGAINIMFIDETTFAISEDARLAIDEYVFDPATQSGTTNFSVLKGVFVFTSGLIGREDPDDVMIDTPSGSIGIRGTIIAGNVDSGEITVIEGAIVLHDFSGNTVTLSNQYETARFDTSGQTIEHMGELGAEDVAERFSTVSNVSGSLFSSIEDSANEGQEEAEAEAEVEQTGAEEAEPEAEVEAEPQGEQQENAPEEAEAEQTAAESAEADNAEPLEASTEPQGEEGEAQPAGEPTAEMAAESEMPPPAPEATIITSDEITGSNIDILGGVNEPVIDLQKPPPPPAEKMINPTPNALEAGVNETQETMSNEMEAPPPFYINVNRFTVGEHEQGAAVARVIGNFTEATQLELVGLSTNFYDIVQQDPNTFIIRLQAGVTAGDAAGRPLDIIATNELGTSSITQNINYNVAYENDPIETTGVGNYDDATYFSGTADSRMVYDMNQEFFDPEGRITNYAVTNGATNGSLDNNIEINGYGQLIIDVNSAPVTGPIIFEVTAYASDGTSIDKDFTYNIENLDQNLTGTNVYTVNPGETYNTFAENITIDDAGATVYADNMINTNNFIIMASGATAKAGGGDDTFNIAADYYNLYGESGIDTFVIGDVRGFIHAGEGNDFVEMSVAMTGPLAAETIATTTYDGGLGYDAFVISNGGNVNLMGVDDGILQNFEEIDLSQGTATPNTLFLSYDNVVSMTDDENRLVIRTDDTGDAIDFDADGHTFYQTNTVGEFDVYTDGTVTLLVDTDAAISGL